MLWLRHFSNARNNPKFKKIWKRLGEAGYARAWILLEVVAERGGSGENFDPRIDLKRNHTDLDWLSDEFGIDLVETKKTLSVFSEVGFIDPKEWSKREVLYVPQMKEYVDEWTRKSLRSNSGATPEDSGVSRSKSLQNRTEQRQSKKQNKKEHNGSATPPFRVLTDSLIREYKKKYRVKPVWMPKDYVQLTNLKKHLDDQEILRRFTNYLQDESAFFKGHPLVKFCSHADVFMGESQSEEVLDPSQFAP